MDFNKSDTALVVIDPQNDVLSEKGVSWGLVGASVRENEGAIPVDSNDSGDSAASTSASCTMAGADESNTA